MVQVKGLLAASSTGSGGDDPLAEETAAKLVAARAELFSLESAVHENTASAYEARSLVQENAALCTKIYHSAFSGNRALTNQNTDDLFRNRLSIIDTFAAGATDGGMSKYSQELMYNQKIAYIAHRANLNQKVLNTTLAMAVVNAGAIEVNRHVMEANEEIVTYNHAMIEENTAWLGKEAGAALAEASPESVAKVIEANAAAVAGLAASTAANKAKVDECLAAAKTNKDALTNAAELVQERLKRIEANRAQIQDNQQMVARMLADS